MLTHLTGSNKQRFVMEIWHGISPPIIHGDVKSYVLLLLAYYQPSINIGWWSRDAMESPKMSKIAKYDPVMERLSTFENALLILSIPCATWWSKYPGITRIRCPSRDNLRMGEWELGALVSGGLLGYVVHPGMILVRAGCSVSKYPWILCPSILGWVSES